MNSHKKLWYFSRFISVSWVFWGSIHGFQQEGSHGQGSHLESICLGYASDIKGDSHGSHPLQGALVSNLWLNMVEPVVIGSIGSICQCFYFLFLCLLRLEWLVLLLGDLFKKDSPRPWPNLGSSWFLVPGMEMYWGMHPWESLIPLWSLILQAAAVVRSDVSIFAGKALVFETSVSWDFDCLVSCRWTQWRVSFALLGICGATLERWQGDCKAKGRPRLLSGCHIHGCFILFSLCDLSLWQQH